MRVQFYLDLEKAELRTQVGRNGHENYFVGDTALYMTNGHPVLSVDDRWTDPPERLRDRIARVEVDTVLARSDLDRRSGLYRLGNAEGVVQRIPAGGDQSVRSIINVSAPTKDEALALWDKILEGSIAPERDYAAPQVVVAAFDPDRLAQLEVQATAMAMTLLEQAMSKLQKSIQPV